MVEKLKDKKVLGAIAVVIFLIIGAGGYFLFIRPQTSQPEASPSPAASTLPSPSLSDSPSPSGSPKATPKPTPTPTPTPSPSPTPVTFSVTAVSASVSPTNYSGACPKKFDFIGNISVNAAGTVTYKWIRSDGATAPTQSLTFGGAGSQAVTTSWTLGGAGKTYTHWEKVQILTPNSIESNQATFNLACS